MADEKDDEKPTGVWEGARRVFEELGGQFVETFSGAFNKSFEEEYPSSKRPGTVSPITSGQEFQQPKNALEQDVATLKTEETSVPVGVPEPQYEWRKINGLAPGVTTMKQIEDIDGNLLNKNVKDATVFNQNVYRKTGLLGMERGPSPRAGKVVTWYRGPGLVDENNQLNRRPYGSTDAELITEANAALIQMNTKPWDRLLLLKELKRVGFYLRDEISNVALNGTGFMEQDAMAMARYLDYSQKQGRTWEASFGQLARISTVQTDSGRRFTPYSDADMGRFLREASFAITGRAPTKEQLQRMLLNSVAMQRRAFAAGTDSPDISTVAQTVVATANPQQKIAYGLGNAISRAFMTLGK